MRGNIQYIIPNLLNIYTYIHIVIYVWKSVYLLTCSYKKVTFCVIWTIFLYLLKNAQFFVKHDKFILQNIFSVNEQFVRT